MKTYLKADVSIKNEYKEENKFFSDAVKEKISNKNTPKTLHKKRSVNKLLDQRKLQLYKNDTYFPQGKTSKKHRIAGATIFGILGTISTTVGIKEMMHSSEMMTLSKEDQKKDQEAIQILLKIGQTLEKINLIQTEIEILQKKQKISE